VTRRGRPAPPDEHLELFGEVPGAGCRVSGVGDSAAERQPAKGAPQPRRRRERVRSSVQEEIGDEQRAPGTSPRTAVSVSTVTHAVRDVLEGAFTPLWVRGEVSDMKAHRNGHWYFCLRDDETQLRCVVWSRDQQRMPAPPDDGMQVVALGQLTVYPARGELQFAVRAMQAEGDGLWRKAVELTLARLQADGLLAPERKRPLVRFPRRIAVVTSPDGAAIQDVIAVVRRRCPAVEVVVVPAKVQGDGAPAELCAALDRIRRWGDVDTVIVGRGGGGREDLWAFNDERLARTLAACPVPTISAVGHEIDLTICDLVADQRAATPSAAAEAAVPVLADLKAELSSLATALASAAGHRLSASHDRLQRVSRAVADAASRDAERRRARVQLIAGRLQALSPLSILSRGYALARDTHGHTLASVSDFSEAQPFDLLLRDGTVRAEARSLRRDPRPPTPNP
jgi:exodeoxyribonuclease VII large subunit